MRSGTADAASSLIPARVTTKPVGTGNRRGSIGHLGRTGGVAMDLQARLSVITLGVADVPRARSFYQALGWPLSGAPQDGVAFFKNAGSRLALYSREAMAEEAGQDAAAPGSIGVALAIKPELP